MTTSKVTAWVAVVALIIGALGLFVGIRALPHASTLIGAAGNMLAEQYEPYIQYNGGFNTNLPVNFGSTTTSVGPVLTSSSVVNGGVLSTTTSISMTMAQSDFTSYTGILMNPIVGSITVTLPATSTLTAFLPTTGQQSQFTFCNATTTASQNITLAGGTGMNVSNATTTLVVTPKKCALLNFIRTANTDIDLMIDIGI